MFNRIADILSQNASELKPESTAGASPPLPEKRNFREPSPDILVFCHSLVQTLRRNIMHPPHHNLGCLFSQLGLPADPQAIEAFITKHRPLAQGVTIYRAPFWSAAQKTFLIEGLIEDADWAAAIDELNSRLS
jgi:hypothetical protein